jgi:biopolymer transport protein ExbD
MPKVKLPRTSPAIDMTPMVDLAFLLVTFFMLTTKFRPEEPVTVTIPYSIATNKLPENLITLTIDSNGRVFYDMEGKDARANLLKLMAGTYKFPITDDEVHRFSVMGAFGVPVSELRDYIAKNDDARKLMSDQSKGIPYDSATVKDDELADWVSLGWRAASEDYSEKLNAKQTVEQPRFAVKADGRVKYMQIKKVIDICQKEGIPRFVLLTSLKVKS